MNVHRSLTKGIGVFALMAAAVVFASGQNDGAARFEPNYEVSLQLVIGSNDSTAGAVLPGSLSPIASDIKRSFGFTNYRLANTILGRVANGGHFEYKSLANVFGQEIDPKSGTFLEWSMTSFRNAPSAKGQGFYAQTFRFGAKVPVTTGSYKDDTGKSNPVINYESIGLSYVKVGVPENTPTLIGTLNLPGANGTIFLVMTVRSAD